MRGMAFEGCCRLTCLGRFWTFERLDRLVAIGRMRMRRRRIVGIDPGLPRTHGGRSGMIGGRFERELMA